VFHANVRMPSHAAAGSQLDPAPASATFVWSVLRHQARKKAPHFRGGVPGDLISVPVGFIHVHGGLIGVPDGSFTYTEAYGLYPACSLTYPVVSLALHGGAICVPVASLGLHGGFIPRTGGLIGVPGGLIYIPVTSSAYLAA